MGETAPINLEFAMRRLDAVNNNINDARRSLIGVLTRFDGLETRFATMESRFAGMEARFGHLERRLAAMEERQESMRAELTGGFERTETALAAILAKLP